MANNKSYQNARTLSSLPQLLNGANDRISELERAGVAGKTTQNSIFIEDTITKNNHKILGEVGYLRPLQGDGYIYNNIGIEEDYYIGDSEYYSPSQGSFNQGVLGYVGYETGDILYNSRTTANVPFYTFISKNPYEYSVDDEILIDYNSSHAVNPVKSSVYSVDGDKIRVNDSMYIQLQDYARILKLVDSADDRYTRVGSGSSDKILVSYIEIPVAFDSLLHDGEEILSNSGIFQDSGYRPTDDTATTRSSAGYGTLFEINNMMGINMYNPYYKKKYISSNISLKKNYNTNILKMKDNLLNETIFYRGGNVDDNVDDQHSFYSSDHDFGYFTLSSTASVLDRASLEVALNKTIKVGDRIIFISDTREKNISLNNNGNFGYSASYNLILSTSDTFPLIYYVSQVDATTVTLPHGINSGSYFIKVSEVENNTYTYVTSDASYLVNRSFIKKTLPLITRGEDTYRPIILTDPILISKSASDKLWIGGRGL